MIPSFRRRYLVVLAAGTALALTAPAADAGAPTEELRAFFAGVNDVLSDPATRNEPLERVARVRRHVAEMADIAGAAAAALGPEWDARSRAERDEFIAVFGDMLERAYVGRLAGAVRATGGVVISWDDEVVTHDGVAVRTGLRGLGGHDIRVEYRMRRVGARWRVRDIVVDGVSIVENYRAQFARILRRDGYPALVTQLRAKLSEDAVLFAKAPHAAPPAAATAAEQPEIAAIAPVESPVRPVTPKVVSVSPKPQAAAPAAIRQRAAEPVHARRAAVAVAAPVSVVASPAVPAPSDAPNAAGQALGGLLLGGLGIGAVLVWRARARRISKRAR